MDWDDAVRRSQSASTRRTFRRRVREQAASLREALGDDGATAVCPREDCCGRISCARSLEAVKAKFEDPYGGHETPGAIWVEPIQGEGGVVVPPKGFLKGLRDIADDAGAHDFEAFCEWIDRNS